MRNISLGLARNSHRCFGALDLEARDAAGAEAVIHLTITDEDPLPQAFVVIEARRAGSRSSPEYFGQN